MMPWLHFTQNQADIKITPGKRPDAFTRLPSQTVPALWGGEPGCRSALGHARFAFVSVAVALRPSSNASKPGHHFHR